MRRTCAVLAERYQRQHTVAPEVPLALVMREGAGTDARTIKAQAEASPKEEVYKACRLSSDERVDAALESVASIAVEIDEVHAGEVAEQISHPAARPTVLLVGDAVLTGICREAISQLDWHVASRADAVLEALGRQLDPALRRRFSRVIEVELATRAERALYLNKRLAAKVRHAVSGQIVDRIAAQGAGFSVADPDRVLAGPRRASTRCARRGTKPLTPC